MNNPRISILATTIYGKQLNVSLHSLSEAERTMLLDLIQLGEIPQAIKFMSTLKECTITPMKTESSVEGLRRQNVQQTSLATIPEDDDLYDPDVPPRETDDPTKTASPELKKEWARKPLVP